MLAIAAAIGLGGADCGGGGGADSGVQPAFTPTFTNVNDKILQLSCTVSGCHTTGANGSVGNLDLTDNPYIALLGDGGGVHASDPGTLDVQYEVMLDGGLVTVDGGLVELDGGVVTLDGGPNFEPYNYHYNGMLLVAPGDPDNSLLFQKLNAGQAATAGCTQTASGACEYGQHMPNVEGEVLDPSYIETVREWIADGALNN